MMYLLVQPPSWWTSRKDSTQRSYPSPSLIEPNLTSQYPAGVDWVHPALYSLTVKPRHRHPLLSWIWKLDFSEGTLRSWTCSVQIFNASAPPPHTRQRRQLHLIAKLATYLIKVGPSLSDSILPIHATLQPRHSTRSDCRSLMCLWSQATDEVPCAAQIQATHPRPQLDTDQYQSYWMPLVSPRQSPSRSATFAP